MINKRLFLKILSLCLLCFIIGSAYTQATTTNTFTISSGVYPGAASYTFYSEGVTYYAKNQFGAICFFGTNFSSVIQQSLDTFTIGGSILFSGNSFTLTNTVTIPKNVSVGGLSTSGTIIHFSGSGYAFLLQGSLGVEYPSFYIHDLTINGDTKTSGRSGIHLYRGGDNCRIERVKLSNLDIGVYADDFEGAKLNNIEIDHVNTGIIGAQTGLSTQNMLSISAFRIISASTIGIQLSQGRSLKINDGQIANSATGITVDNDAIDVSIGNINFEQNTVADINLAGSSESYPVQNVAIRDISFRGRSAISYAISVGYVNTLLVDNCHFYDYPSAIYFATNTATGISLTLINPGFTNITYPFSSISLGYSLARLCGSIITPHWCGILVKTDANVIVGQVMKYANLNGLITSAGDDAKSPVVVMYAQAANGITAIATSGIVKVNNGSAVTAGDTLGSLYPNLCHTNNALTDPLKIIGCVWGIDDSTHIYAKIR